jgi:hypothetical protein
VISGPAAWPAVAWACLILAVIVSGCGDSPWRGRHDYPYAAETAERGAGKAVRDLNSRSPAERLAALRLLAYLAGEAGRRGEAEEAARLEEAIIRRYRIEKEAMVRAGIVRIYAPMAGPGDGRMAAFLRERIAAGEYPGYAALSLAALAPPGAFEDIERLTRHPDPEIRFQAAEALTALGDPRGFSSVARVWHGMREPQWPAMMGGTDLAAARGSLAARAGRVFARPLF